MKLNRLSQPKSLNQKNLSQKSLVEVWQQQRKIQQKKQIKTRKIQPIQPIYSNPLIGSKTQKMIRKQNAILKQQSSSLGIQQQIIKYINRMIMSSESIKENLVDRYSEFKSITKLLGNEANMGYKDYEDVRVFYEAYRKQYQDVPLTWEIKYEIVLLAAKAYYIRYEYESVLKTIQQNLPVPPRGQLYTFKIFYERQILLLKSFYLHNPRLSHILDLVIKEYLEQKVKCPDWPKFQADSDLYDGTVELLWSKLKKGSIVIKKYVDGSKVFTDWIQIMKAPVKIFQGIPVYLVSNKWLQKARLFANNPKENTYPGPAFNLELTNHIFQFEQHIQQNKFYMNSLLFPFTESIDYIILSSKQWELTLQKFEGSPIKRFPTMDNKFSIKCSSDCLVKIFVENSGTDFIFQWQAGLSWKYSILPNIRKFFGMGQLKELVKKINHNKIEYIQEVLVEDGIIQQTKNRYKFTKISPNLNQKLSTKLLAHLLTKYNLQPYNQKPNPQTHSQGVVAFLNNEQDLSKYAVKLKKILDIQESISFQYNIQQINSVLCSLASVQELMFLYRGQIYIQEFSADWSDEEIQYTISFADFIKKVWYSNCHQNTVNPLPLIKAFLFYSIQKHFQKPKFNNFPYQKTPSHSISHKLEQLLAPLHHIQTSKYEQLIYSQFQILRATGITNFKKMNRLEIFNIFNQFHYQELSCRRCHTSVGYKILPKLSMLVNVKQHWEYLNFFFVKPRPKQQQDKITFSNHKLGKTVQQVNFKLPLNKSINDVIMLLKQKCGLMKQNNKSQIIPLFINRHNDEFQQIQKLSTSIKDINSFIFEKVDESDEQDEIKRQKSNIENQWFLFMFLIDSLDQSEQLALVKFIDPKTGKNKGFQQLIKIPELISTFKQGQNIQLNKQTIKARVSIKNIIINKLQIFQRKQNSRRRINKLINIYTQTKIGSAERLGKNSFDTSVEQNEDYSVTLQQCIKNTYHYQDPNVMKSTTKNNSNLQLNSERILCHKCKKSRKCTIQTKLLDFRKVIAIGLNRKNLTQPYRISTCIKFPQHLNSRDFLLPPPSPTKKKPSQYILKSMVLFQSNLNQQLNITKIKPKYGTVVRSIKDNKWYLIENQSKKQVKIEDVDGRRVELLIYQRQEN